MTVASVDALVCFKFPVPLFLAVQPFPLYLLKTGERVSSGKEEGERAGESMRSKDSVINFARGYSGWRGEPLQDTDDEMREREQLKRTEKRESEERRERKGLQQQQQSSRRSRDERRFRTQLSSTCLASSSDSLVTLPLHTEAGSKAGHRNVRMQMRVRRNKGLNKQIITQPAPLMSLCLPAPLIPSPFLSCLYCLRLSL